MIGITDPFNGHIDEFRIAHVERSEWHRPLDAVSR
jgi:hypothetical protein